MSLTSGPARLAGIELGGTNAVAVLGEGSSIVERVGFPVGSPSETLGQLAAQLDSWNRQQRIDALGVASFGPVRVDSSASDFGKMLKTPKPGWTGADVLSPLAEILDGPVALHTDVTAAALAEGHCGAARSCRNHVYVTVGTGVGFGIVADGKPLSGILHPEAGHLRIRRVPGDDFAGACPFHGDCLEGLISGPALATRTGHDPALLPPDDHCWAMVADALAEACAMLFLTVATERIVIGGGVVRNRSGIIAEVARLCATKLGGYLPHVGELAPVVPAELPDSGAKGALLLAEAKLSERSC